VRFEQTFTVASTPKSVFDYMADPANLRGQYRPNHHYQILDSPPTILSARGPQAWALTAGCGPRPRVCLPSGPTWPPRSH
jgi:hypothetical protein